MLNRLGLVRETYESGSAGQPDEGGRAAHGGWRTVGGAVRRPQPAGSRWAGAALLAGSACTRFGVFRAGLASADDPRYTVEPQRARLDAAGLD